MSILEWFKKFRQKQDATAKNRADAIATQTPDERKISSGDIEAAAADARAARAAGLTPTEADRLGDDE